ncbi:Two-component sensor histidine kinase, ATPase/histidine kinase/DNA gyrase B/HSP90 domain protein [Thermobacillus xylanilyticus]|jgi:Predicted signal transduction protein with a C-terminal ATPase domain|uniref:histidine kinase n=1 Tax=Thermobacillus xylanilyticus TaxID=76633 RepID=A0ABN7S015_THEXY|nr:sensor histidine kinase [Thermobacillus xylanilyticus]CAG5086157.1 Two-component sensor histidine kinase, ATPase/histidine kinase/DNA gyrase B/HSP90 domain protein [Thermobacillus xylanilyticus]
MKRLFSRMSIVRKMVLGYFVIIFVPVITFGFYHNHLMYQSMIEEYASGKQQVIEQSYANLRIDLLQISSNYGLFQHNANVIDYLNGAYRYNWEYVYSYQKYIKPLLSGMLYGNDHIRDIRIYKASERVFTAPEHIIDMEALPSNVREELRRLPPGKGLWFCELSESGEWKLAYYQNMYAERFSKHVGVFSVEVDPKLLYSFANTLSNEGRSDVYLLTGDLKSSPPGAREDMIGKMLERPFAYFFLDRKSLLVNHLTIEELGLRAAVVSKTEDVFASTAKQRVWLYLMIAGLLLLLSGIYYMLAVSVTKRLSRLARHMRQVGENNFKTLDHRDDQDEIGYLTYTYNSMLQRIDELVNKVQRSELLRKESAYKALQAQVKPHFLYNTLETIRMLAEANDDREVAELAYSFGQFMRYSLSSDHEQFRLSDEVRNIENYMKIQKTRLGSRLTYSISVEADIRQIPCPQFILQPLVENCIVHGLSTIRRKGAIAIRITDDDNRVRVEISDNGAGMPEQRLEEIRRLLNNRLDIKEFSTQDSGLGIYNVSERIKTYYGEDSRLEVDSKPGEGTDFRLYLNKKGMNGHVEPADRG